MDEEVKKGPGEAAQPPGADSKKKRKKKKPVQFECGFAPPGDSTIAFTHTYMGKTETYNLSLKNKIYTLPEKLSKEDEERYRQALISNNFQDVTVNTSAVFNKQTGKTTYKAMHPEHTEKNRINATIAVVIRDSSGSPVLDDNGKQKTAQVTILEGIVKTGDKSIYNALIKSGFYDAGSKKGGKNG